MQSEITIGANLVPLSANPSCSEFVFYTFYNFINSPLLAQSQDQAFRKLKPRCRFRALECCSNGLVPNVIFFQNVESLTHFPKSGIFFIWLKYLKYLTITVSAILAYHLLFSVAAPVAATLSKDQNMSNPKERRYYPRAKVKLPVVRMAGNDLVDGEIEDLSLGGAFIRCSAMPNGKDNFHMVISVKGRLISLTGEMVWKDVQKFNNQTRFRGMGVRFSQLLISDRQFLGDVIAKHHKKKFTAWLPRRRKAHLGD